MLLFTAVKRKKQTNILSGKSNGTYDKKLTCYCVGKWDSRQVQTWTSHSFEKGSFSTQLFKPCSLCEDYLYEEKNTLAKRPQADSHCDMDLVSHFAQQASRPLPILWDWVAESSYCRTSAREDGSSAASTRTFPGILGTECPAFLPSPFAALGQFSDCQWQPLQMQDPIWSVLLRSSQVRHSPETSERSQWWRGSDLHRLGTARDVRVLPIQPRAGAVQRCFPYILLITSYGMNVNLLAFLALYLTFSTVCTPVH